jgi:hypothetical protein
MQQPIQFIRYYEVLIVAITSARITRIALE